MDTLEAYVFWQTLGMLAYLSLIEDEEAYKEFVQQARGFADKFPFHQGFRMMRDHVEMECGEWIEIDDCSGLDFDHGVITPMHPIGDQS